MGSIPITRSADGRKGCAGAHLLCTQEPGSVAQRQSTGLITPWLQVRILSDPLFSLQRKPQRFGKIVKTLLPSLSRNPPVNPEPKAPSVLNNSDATTKNRLTLERMFYTMDARRCFA